MKETVISEIISDHRREIIIDHRREEDENTIVCGKSCDVASLGAIHLRQCASQEGKLCNFFILTSRIFMCRYFSRQCIWQWLADEC